MAGHILLAEDDKALSALMQDFFRAAGVQVTPAYDGGQALALAQERAFDLLVLDVMMPHLNGLEVCAAVRHESDVPVIFVTALGQEGDTLAGFRAGADDYVTKPFSFPVLVAKAQALMRRARGLRLGASELGYGSILMDTATGAVTVDGAPVTLRPKEAQILELLLREQGRTVSRDLLIERVWGVEFDGDERMVDRHVAGLRKALGTAAQHIKAVYGKGYRLGGIVMKRIRQFWERRSVATKVTVCSGLFLFLAAYTLFDMLWNDASTERSDIEHRICRYYNEQITANIEASGYAAWDIVPELPGKTAAPAYGTEGYAALKMLLVDGIDDTSPAALFYYDETGQPVTILSPVFLYTSEGSEAAGDVVRVPVDIGGLSVDDLYEVFHTMRRAHPEWAGNSSYLTIYGKRYENGYIEANRVVSCIDQTAWTAQRPVPEEESWRVYFQQRTQSDALLDAWMDAREYLTAYGEQLAANGLDYPMIGSDDFTAVPTQVYGISIWATHTYDHSAAVWDDIDGLVLAIVVAFWCVSS